MSVYYEKPLTKNQLNQAGMITSGKTYSAAPTSPKGAVSQVTVTAAAYSKAGAAPATAGGLFIELVTTASLAAAATETNTIHVPCDSILEKIGVFARSVAETDMDVDFEKLADIDLPQHPALLTCHDMSDSAGDGKQPYNLAFFKGGTVINVTIINRHATLASIFYLAMYFRQV